MSSAEEPAIDPYAADVFSRNCSSRAVLQDFTGRWGALTVVALKRSDGRVRFGEIRRRVEGISDRMLSQTLGRLERDGLVERNVHSSIPPHVDYALTALGQRIAEPLATLIGIVEADLPEVLVAQQAYDEREPGSRRI